MHSTTLNPLPPNYISAWGKSLHEDQLILGWTAELSCLRWNNSHPVVSEASCFIWNHSWPQLPPITHWRKLVIRLVREPDGFPQGKGWLENVRREELDLSSSHHRTKCHLIMYIYSAMLSLLWRAQCCHGFSCCYFLRHSTECCFLSFFIFMLVEFFGWCTNQCLSKQMFNFGT